MIIDPQRSPRAEPAAWLPAVRAGAGTDALGDGGAGFLPRAKNTAI